MSDPDSPPPDPLRAPARLSALRATALLDTPAEAAFDRLTTLATQVLHAPVSLVTLIDEDRQFFKSCIGFPEPWATARETPLSHSFCQHVVARAGALVIEDAREHPLVRDSLAIGDLRVVAYAGIPLVDSSGEVLGSFCVIDHVPRRWREEELEVLRQLAASVITEIELRSALGALRESEGRYRTVIGVLQEGIAVFDADGRITSLNARAEQVLGLPETQVRGARLIDLPWRAVREDRTPFPREAHPALEALRTGQAVRDVVMGVRRADSNEPIWLRVNAAPLDPTAPAASRQVICSLRDITARRMTEESARRLAAERASREAAEAQAHRFAFLAEAGEALAASLDEQALLFDLAHLAVTAGGDWCAVDLVREDGTLDRVAVAGARPEAGAALETLRQAPLALERNPLAQRALASLRAELEAETDVEVMARAASTAEQATAVRALRPMSRLCVPLVAQWQCLGLVTLVRSAARPDPRPFDGADLALAEALVRHASLAVVNARLYARERAAREEVRAAAPDWQRTFAAIEPPMLLVGPDLTVLRTNAFARRLARADAEGAPVSEGEPGARDSAAAGDDATLTGRALATIGPSALWREAAGVVREALRHDAPAYLRTTFWCGARRWQLMAWPLRADGDDRTRVVIGARDLTEILRLQESLRANETMSKLGAVTAGVAHEVRNPLFGISATLDAFESSFPGHDEFAPFVEQLRQQVDRLRELMHELLDYGRPTPTVLSPGSVTAVLARAAAQRATLAERLGVRVEVEPVAPLPPVAMDRGRLVQVFENLVDNALRHSPPGSTVRLSAARSMEDGRAWVACTVRDEGPGFAEADLPHLFEPFYTRRQGGTGLGLSIVERIARDHGGQVRAANAPEGGGLVTVRLPAAEGESHD